MDEVFINHIKDLSRRSEKSLKYTFTDFLNLDEQNSLTHIKQELIPYELFGGTEGCERVLARFGAPDEIGYEADFPIRCIKITPLQQKFADDLSHRDILGAVINLGIDRACIGDIVIRDNTAYLFALEKISTYICENLIRVKHTSVNCQTTENIPVGELFKTEEQKLIVSSLRTDCVISALYNLSRSNAQKLFAAQKVFIDGKCCLNGAVQLKTNDTVSVRGFGRFIFADCTGNTKKGRLVISLKRYI